MTLFKNIDARFFIVFGVNCALFFLIGVMGDILSGIGAYIYIPAFLIVPSSLFLKFWQAVFMAVFFGFLFEAQTPLDGALTPVLFAAASFIVCKLRAKFRSLDSFGITWLTWSVNMSMYLFSVLFIFPIGISGAWAYFFRVVFDALISSLVAALFSAYAVNLNKAVAYLLGVSLNVGEDA
ncbi:MAG: hypothetical protein J6R08_07340 [Opitutales bacterium]|nr:hypothetical protein [Opitutales bacterium]